MHIRLQTPRLYFREFTLADAQMLFDMHLDPAITRYTGDPIPWDSIELVEGILTDIIMPQYANKIGRWAVHLKSNDEFIGWCGLKDVGDHIDLGYRYLQKHWGHGYASEAAKAVLEYGVAMKLPHIIGRSDPENKASVRVLEKIGLSYRGIRSFGEGWDESVWFEWAY